MRNAFAAELLALAEKSPRLILLSGDIGNRLFDPLKAQFPERFYNCGVAEANMIGVAAGLAMCGWRPVVYTIAPFATTRCLEQIKLDLCYHNLPVLIVGTGAGLSYAALGATHHSFEDIAILRALPNITIVCPADAAEVRAAMRALVNQRGPAYLRLGKKGEPAVHADLPEFKIGRAICLAPGDTVCLLAVGNMVAAACRAAQLLRETGIDAGVLSFHTVKPLDEPALKTVFTRARLVVTVEEHSLIGGLGGAVAEWRADHPTEGGAILMRCGLPDAFAACCGGQSYARKQAGLTPEDIVARVLQLVRKEC